MPEFTRRQLISSAAATAALGGIGVGTAAADDSDDPGAPFVDGRADLFATTAFGAEVTGPFVFETNELLFSLQHPSTDNPDPWSKGAIGVVEGHEFTMDGSNDDFDPPDIPTTETEQQRVRTAGGTFEILAQEQDPINGGEDALGVPTTPDGTRIDEYSGSLYSDLGHNPDMNQFVATNDDGTEGYLFTNFEQSPGEIGRIPLSRGADGWEADLDNAINLSTLSSMRAVGGTRINCAGDLTPWSTPISAEEEYSHPLTTGTASVSDVVEAGTGVGMRGAGHFFNRPNPAGIQSAVDNLFGDDSWYVQGYWALSGVELLAYYLGNEQADQDGGGDSNDTFPPLFGTYPNKYRYGHFVEVRDPMAEEPRVVKHWAMGRASWELPEFADDKRTVFATSDGQDKGGLYKFVAEDPISDYDDPMDVRGTLYAPKRTNVPENKERPRDAVIELEWLPLGTASNREVESWIADYDHVNQWNYLQHADTPWWEDFDQALAEADREVAKNGNKDYIDDEAIVEWARQYEQRGPDGVDEELRRVPFLETRAATREVNGAVEFRKSEGIDTSGNATGARPGNDMYIGLAEVNAGMADGEGQLRHRRVDGGMVYRGTVDENYDVTRLEPAVVGPDASDPASVANRTPLNVDNTYVLDDGRVLLAEDADQLGRSYPNDGLYVYEPSDL